MSTITDIPTRLLLGSGPSPVPARVLEALAQPTIGHMDPAFAAIMGETIELLREAFQTENTATLPVSGTGSAGMEALVANFVDPGDRVVCGVHGLFGARMADELARAGAEVVKVEAEWGRAIDNERLVAAAADGLDAMVVVHGETSTGVAQPLDGLADACRDKDALLLIDCVTSLGGHPLRLDEAGVDAAFSGTQKCLNCPPGLAPFTAGERAIAKLQAREQPGRSWYFDLSLVLGYWNPEQAGATARAYHHTAPINMIYALREALRIAVVDEWLPTAWERHRKAHHALKDALSRARLRAPRARRRAAAPAARGLAAGGHRRGRRPQRAAARPRHRDLRRPRPARRQALADRRHGRGRPARAAGAARHGALRAARSRPRRAARRARRGLARVSRATRA